jgi:hypothetical protein
MKRLEPRGSAGQQQQAQQQQQAAYAQQRSEYDRAVRACLTGRGYTIQ